VASAVRPPDNSSRGSGGGNGGADSGTGGGQQHVHSDNYTGGSGSGNGDVNGGGHGLTKRCILMNPKLAEFTRDGVPHAMWAYMWSHDPATGCYLPNGVYVEAGYYVYRVDSDHVGAGWQLDLAEGKAELNQTRGQAMKKEWGSDHQTSFIYSAWDLPPLDVPPSTIFRVDTTLPLPRVGETLLQCYGPPGNARVLGIFYRADIVWGSRMRPLDLTPTAWLEASMRVHNLLPWPHLPGGASPSYCCHCASVATL
jgi:hypothetical protein